MRDTHDVLPWHGLDFRTPSPTPWKVFHALHEDSAGSPGNGYSCIGRRTEGGTMGSRTLTGRVLRTTSLKLSLLIGVLAMVGCRDSAPARLTAPSTASLANGADQS